MPKYVLLILALALIFGSARAADLVVKPLGKGDPTLVIVHGTLNQNDAEQFRAKVGFRDVDAV